MVWHYRFGRVDPPKVAAVWCASRAALMIRPILQRTAPAFLALWLAGCSILTARQGDGTLKLTAKCMGTTTIMIGTLGLALPFVMPAIERGEFVGPCDTLAGIQSPSASGPENAARVREFLRNFAAAQGAAKIDHRGCCSWHQGIMGCDLSNNRIVCNDGHYSPTCECE